MAKALDRPEKAQFHLITFRHGNPEVVDRFTNWDSPIDPGGLNYIPVPKMKIVLANNTGTFGEASTKITMEIEDAPDLLDPLTRGTPFAPVSVVIEEIVEPARIGDSGSDQFVAVGVISSTRRNANGKEGQVVLEIKNRKTMLDIAMGFQINAHCPFRLNGPGCNEATHGPTGYAPAFGTVTIDGKTLTVNDAGLLLDLTNTRTWTRGFVEFNNIKIGIFNYDDAQNGNVTKVFQMVRQAPVEWEGQSVLFHPGCTKQIDGDGGCRDAWDVEEGFGGSGIAIPAYNPISENPAGA